MDLSGCLGVSKWVVIDSTYLAAVIPSDPKGDHINKFTDVIVDELVRSYNHGT